jgi:hypothetical protein
MACDAAFLPPDERGALRTEMETAFTAWASV